MTDATSTSTTKVPTTIYSILTDQNGVVTQSVRSNCSQSGMISVSQDIYNQVQGQEGKFTFIKGVLSNYTSAQQTVIIPNVTLRQFCVQLTVMNKITQDEALAWIQGIALPAEVLIAVDQLPSGQQFTAKALLFGAQTFERVSSLAVTLGTLLQLTSTDLDDLWIAAAQQ